MGADSARSLAAEGFKVGILSSSGKGEALAQELGGVGVTGTNRSLADLQKLVDAAMNHWGRVDVLVNSAGHGPRAPVLELSDDDWHEGMEVYFLNAVRPTRLVTPIMQAQGGGTIINISTFAAFEPNPVFPTSGVMRAGFGEFHQALCGQVCGRQHPHEQRAAGLYRQPAREGGVSVANSDGALWPFANRDRRHCRLFGQRSRRIYYRSEHSGGWRDYAIGLKFECGRIWFRFTLAFRPIKSVAQPRRSA